jgi:DnaJ-class molecular chaperone
VSTRDHYAVLGVSREASTHEIRDAYWRQVRTYSTGLEPGDRLRELRDAY